MYARMTATRTVLGISAAVLVVFLGAAIAVVLNPSLLDRFVVYLSANERDRIAVEALTLMEAGQFAEAALKAEAVIHSSAGADHAVARSIVDSGKFMTGETDARIQAIRLTKETYVRETGNAYNQSLQVNKLLGYINSGFEPYVFDEVFAGEPFQKFHIEGDIAGSIRALAEHSITLNPTTESLFRLGQWNADRIRDLYGDWGATPEEKEQYANDILRIIAAADELIDSEMATVEGRPFDYTVQPRFFFWKSYLYGAAARVQPEYLEDAKIALDNLVQSYETTVDASGKPYPVIATRLPYGYFSYAWSLYEVAGERALPDVRENLDALVDIIEANPNIHAGAYLSAVREAAARSPENQARYYRGYLELAKVSPRFKTFLESYGWTFTQ